MFPEVESRTERRRLERDRQQRRQVRAAPDGDDDPSLIGTRQIVRLAMASDYDQLLKGNIVRDVPEGARKVTDQQVRWIDKLGVHRQHRERLQLASLPERRQPRPGTGRPQGGAGRLAADARRDLGLAIPIGVAAAVYLEEFAPKNR